MNRPKRPVSYWLRRPLQLFISSRRADLVGPTYCPFCHARVYEFGLECSACGVDLVGRKWNRELDRVSRRFKRLGPVKRFLFEGLSYLEDAVRPKPVKAPRTPPTQR